MNFSPCSACQVSRTRICSFVSQVRIWSRTPDHARRCAEDVGGIAVDSAEAAVCGADVIATVSVPSSAPILCGSWVKQGAIVTGETCFYSHW